MKLSYKKLWHLLLDRNMNKSRLRESGIHSTTIAKMNKGEYISTEAIEKICELLQVQPGDIMEFIPDTAKAGG